MKKCETDRKLFNFAASAAIAVFLVALAGVVWASSGDDVHGGSHNRWLTVDTWKVVNFCILAVLGFFIAKKPVSKFFASRKQNIKEEIGELEQKKADAEKKLLEYQTQFENLDKESKQIVENFIKQGEEAKIRIITEAEAQAEKLEEMAKRNIEQEFKAARVKLQQEIAAKAVEKASEVIKDAISGDDQERLVDHYLKKVVA